MANIQLFGGAPTLIRHGLPTLLRRELPSLADAEGAQPAEVDDSGETPLVMGASFGGRYIHANSQATSLTVSAFYRAVELRARTMSQLLVQYQRKTGGGNFVESMYGTDRHLNYLLQKSPNPLMSASVLMKEAEVDIIMRGNAFIYIDRGVDGEIEALWLCNSGFYHPTSDTYTLTYNGVGGLVHLEAPSRDVIHIPNTFRAPGGYMGLPTLAFAAACLGLAATNNAQAMDIAAKGGKMKLIVQEKDTQPFGMSLGRAAKSELEKITMQLNKDIYSYDVVHLNNIASVMPISQNAQQMELLESRKFSVPEIARFTGVPTIYLMDGGNSSYKTPDAANQEFYTRTIQPKIREWEDELDRKLLTGADFGKRRFHVCELPLFRLDPEKQGKLDKVRLETGVCTVNELRQQYDQPSIPDGDRHYISTNLAEVGSDKLRLSKGQTQASDEASAEPTLTEKGGES